MGIAIPTYEDLLAVWEMGLGPKPEHNPPQGWATLFNSASSSATYRVEVRPDTVHGGTYMFCECPAWPFSRGRGEDCKHVRQARAAWSRGQ